MFAWDKKLKVSSDWTNNRADDCNTQYVYIARYPHTLHQLCEIILRENRKETPERSILPNKLWQICWERQAGPQHRQNERMCGTVARAQSEKLESPLQRKLLRSVYYIPDGVSRFSSQWSPQYEKLCVCVCFGHSVNCA